VAGGEPVRDLPETFYGSLPDSLSEARPYCRGCLVLSARGGRQWTREDLQALSGHADFQSWPLLILVEDALFTAGSTEKFLWSVFTRFDPASHIFSAAPAIQHNHVVHRGPILMDARMKPDFPSELFCDEETASLVSRRWKEYFPENRVQMGETW